MVNSYSLLVIRYWLVSYLYQVLTIYKKRRRGFKPRRRLVGKFYDLIVSNLNTHISNL